MINLDITKIKIEKMNIEDLNIILPILTSEFDDYWTPDTLKNDFNSTTSSYFIATYLNEIVGFIGVKSSYDTADIMNIVVKKNFRNQKVGSILLMYVLDNSYEIKKSTDTKLTSFMLEVNSKNTSAIKLYKKYGFNIIAKRKNYYNDSDALIMKKEM